MDAIKLQKINALASELRKHNFAMSSEDAFKQAETVYDGNASGGAQVLVMEQHPAFTTQQPQAPTAPPADEMTSRKIELLIENHGKKYEEEFNVLRGAINQLIGELNTIKSQLAKGTSSAAPSEEPRAHKEKQAELKTETKEDHPRQGKFQPADVDIQKMFYFGAKR